VSAGVRTPIIRVFDCHIRRESVERGVEYLLLKRSANKIYAGSWRMVGGKLRDNETAWQACLRELHEETQLKPLRLLVVPYVNRFYEWQHDRINDIPVFLAIVADGATPMLDAEHSSYEWLTLDAALARLPWPGQRDGLLAAHALPQAPSLLSTFLEIPLALAEPTADV
jgi:dihydroneopterin triphosphate diphosphatase